MCNTCTKSALYTGKLKLITKTTYCPMYTKCCVLCTRENNSSLINLKISQDVIAKF